MISLAASRTWKILERAIERPRLAWRIRPRKQGWSRRIEIAALLGLFLLGSYHFPGLLQARAAQPKRKVPNLLVIISDDQSGFCLGAAGDWRGATPHLDALARQGVFFERTFCNSPLCTSSRQSFITGMLPHATGVTRLETKLPERALTLGRWLGSLGFRTAAVGKMHFNGPSRHGFDTRIDVAQWLTHLQQHPPPGGDRRREWRPFIDPAPVWLNARNEDHGLPADAMESTFFVDQAIEYMNQDRAKPFALVVGFYDPHAPFRFPREWRGRYLPSQFAVPPTSELDRQEQPKIFHDLTNDDFRGIQAAYYTSLSFMDFQTGRLIQALEDSGLGSDTLVVFLSDNGYLLGQHGRVEKNCLYEPAVRVPLIMRWPGYLPQGKRIQDMVELVDLFPTVCHLLSVLAPSGLQGIDLTPLIEGKPMAGGRDVVFSEYNESEEAMVRSDRFKLIVGSGRRERKDHLESGSPLSGPYQRLFDLTNDPNETIDVSGDAQFSRVRTALLHRMYERLAATWVDPEQIPGGLSELESIHWFLRPRDKIPQDK
jgi:arylsulfatase A-like enzyme